jgi:hypothetical protein
MDICDPVDRNVQIALPENFSPTKAALWGRVLSIGHKAIRVAKRGRKKDRGFCTVGGGTLSTRERRK